MPDETITFFFISSTFHFLKAYSLFKIVMDVPHTHSTVGLSFVLNEYV